MMKPPERVHSQGERFDGDEPQTSQHTISVPVSDAEAVINELGGQARDGSFLIADGSNSVVAVGAKDPDQLALDLHRAESKIKTTAELNRVESSDQVVEQLSATTMMDAAITREEILDRNQAEIQRRLLEDRLQEERQQYMHYANRERQLQRTRIRSMDEE